MEKETDHTTSQAIPGAYGSPSSLFNKSIDSLVSLHYIPKDEIDEGSAVKPSSYAYRESWKLLHEIRKYFQKDFPYCSASLESRGGIHLVWDNTNLQRRVWVEVPHKRSETICIFCREKESSRFYDNFSLIKLCSLLTWLNTFNNSNSVKIK
jgi:hypothetical protein